MAESFVDGVFKVAIGLVLGVVLLVLIVCGGIPALVLGSGDTSDYPLKRSYAPAIGSNGSGPASSEPAPPDANTEPAPPDANTEPAATRLQEIARVVTKSLLETGHAQSGGNCWKVGPGNLVSIDVVVPNLNYLWSGGSSRERQEWQTKLKSMEREMMDVAVAALQSADIDPEQVSLRIQIVSQPDSRADGWW